MGWWKDLFLDLTTTDWERDIANVGGDWHNLRVDQKINLLAEMGYDDDEGNPVKSNQMIDGVLRIFLGDGNE